MSTPPKKDGEAPTPIPASERYPNVGGAAKGKGKSGEHPALADVVRRLEENERVILPELAAQTTRLVEAANASSEPPPAAGPHRASPWYLVVRGKGPRGNNAAADVERLAALLVAELRTFGHEVEVATVSFDDGTAEDVTSPVTIRSLTRKEIKP